MVSSYTFLKRNFILLLILCMHRMNCVKSWCLMICPKTITPNTYIAKSKRVKVKCIVIHVNYAKKTIFFFHLH